MGYTNALAIVQKISDLINAPVKALVPTMSFNLDEPINPVFSDLPLVSTYPIREDFVYDESTNGSDKKSLSIRIEFRMKGGPASTVCTPIVNAIAAALKASPRLDGLAIYVELQSIQWANDTTGSGNVCGAAIDVQVFYFAA